MKCPIDGKRCYVKDPYKKGVVLNFIDDELPKKCRHGEFYSDTVCPAWRDKK